MIITVLIILFVIGFFMSSADEREVLGWEIFYSILKAAIGGIILVALFFVLDYFGIINMEDVRRFIREQF